MSDRDYIPVYVTHKHHGGSLRPILSAQRKILKDERPKPRNRKGPED